MNFVQVIQKDPVGKQYKSGRCFLAADDVVFARCTWYSSGMERKMTVEDLKTATMGVRNAKLK